MMYSCEDFSFFSNSSFLSFQLSQAAHARLHKAQSRRRINKDTKSALANGSNNCSSRWRSQNNRRTAPCLFKISGESREGPWGESCPPPPFFRPKLRPLGPRHREKAVERSRTPTPTPTLPPPHLPEGLDPPLKIAISISLLATEFLVWKPPPGQKKHRV